jgi:molybdopterin-guanine dinucleotide biosynthesis protein A
MTDAVLGLILAGGQARRMGGGDKAMLRVGGRTILERVIDSLKPQCAALVLNANGDPARFAGYGLPVIGDSIEGFAGPLAGILAGLDWTAVNRPDIDTVVSMPADCPFPPGDLVRRLRQAREAGGARLACAASAGWRHPASALWAVSLREDLRRAMTVEGERKIDAWTARHGVAAAEWPATPFDPFFNVNTPADAAEADALAARLGL